ncbi:MAG: MBOAT family protein [Gammaproteobacteria bacterium]|nr:MBOAT family protein [Gammaproteobacteria bacterium]
MLFTSIHFLIFFPIVIAIYFLLPNRIRWLHLLIASYYFYMAWQPIYALLLFLSSLIFYLSALGVDYCVEGSRLRKAFFLSGLTINLAMLFVFKYYNFFEIQVDHFFNHHHWRINFPHLDILLPIGISFYTFQGISYLVDVYRNELKAERHLGLLMLYKAFFPQLIAGPIERGKHFIPQLRKILSGDDEQRIHFDYQRVVSGLRLMLLGFFKKIVLADNLALIVNPVYAAPTEFSSISALIATFAFAFQIYFDFSAYTDIARGCARILGFELLENFNMPYLATSIPDFWRRWHITLSSWFRDYLYIPLGGNRVSKLRWMLNLWIVFLLCGFWHGANWTFLIWGALYGFYYFLDFSLKQPMRKLVEHTFLKDYPVLCKYLQIFITFSMVSWAWVVFRAENLSQAITIWKKIIYAPIEIFNFAITILHTSKLLEPFYYLGWLIKPDGKLSLLPVYLLIFTLGYHFFDFRVKQECNYFATLITWQRWVIYFFAISCILLFGQYAQAPFIYFQF